jgi:peptidoglycan glycosyltransferase
MPVQSTVASASQFNRKIELRLLLFSLLIVASGMFLCYFGKLAVTTPLGPKSINVNTATASQLAEALLIDQSTARAVIKYRYSLPDHVFASVSRLRRAPMLKDIAVNWDWQLLGVRSESDVARDCIGAFLLFAFSSLLIHIVYRRSAQSGDPYLLPIVSLLSGIGLMVALSVHDPLRDTFAFANQAVGAGCFGPAAMLLPLTKQFRKLPLHRYTYFYAATALLFLVTLFVFGHGPAETHIQLFGFEPIEIIKVFLIFFITSYLSDRRMSIGEKPGKRIYLPAGRDFLPLLAVYLFALSLFGAVKDLGPAVLLFGTFVAILYLVTGQSVYPVLGLVLLLIAGYVGDKLGIGFFATRVEMWLHPWDNTNRLGGQLAQGLWGISTGGIFGSGLGLGGSYYVPRAGSDMAFTSIGEELGLIGGLCVLILYVVIIFRGFQIARSALDDFDRLLASGITVLIGLQALVITGGATGLIPLTGITMPFVSYGTSSLVANFFCVGILLSLSSKLRGSNVSIAAPKLFNRCSQRVTLALATCLLIFVGVGRLVWLQGIIDAQTATRTLRIPDADKTYRYHRNPRLVAYAMAIPRGIIRDRNGVILAKNAPQDTGITYLTNGVARSYPLGSTGASLVLAVEQPSSQLNPLGSDKTLRGYGSMLDLLPLYRQKDLPFPPHPAGQDVTLTVDIGLQREAQNALNAAAKEYGNGCGAAVVMNSHTGALLAAATAPTFDPNQLTAVSWNAMHESIDTSQPLLNRAFAGTYVPGSVFKLVTATAACQQDKTGLQFTCDHKLDVLRWSFKGHHYLRRNIVDDEEFAPHGVTTMAKAIRVSCNVYFAQLGVAIGAAPLESAIHQYGLNECPDLQLLGPDLPDCAYGQGTIQVTPYQMAAVCQTIANSGVSAAPKFFVDNSEDKPGKRILTKADAARLSLMMSSVVQNGTAAGVFPGLSVAGKTGSAQLGTGSPHSWFVGFAPVEQPSIAFSCVVEHGGHGRTAAGSVCRSIVKVALR